MKKLNESYLEIKKSKFYGYLYEISFLEDVTNILDEFKIKHKKARHIVYSYKYNSNEKIFNDKEPVGSTRGILEVIKKNELDNTLIIIVRYFGGILLGSGPLTRAYTKTAALLIKK